MTASQFSNPPDSYPSGTIKMAYMQSSQVPAGWVVCDGNNGTPDLRDKFIKGTTSASALPGSTGGEASKSLAVGQMATHDHGGSTPSTGSHDHSWTGSTTDNDTREGADGSVEQHGAGGSEYSQSEGGHGHSGVSFGSAGSGNSYDNRPKNTTVLYIKKL